MNWKDPVNRGTLSDIEDLAYPPSGGKWKMLSGGILLPLGIGYFAVRAWIDREAVWFGRNDINLDLKGEAARAMALCYLGAAAWAHFRWFWGLKPAWRVFTIGTVCSLVLILGGCGAACYHVFR